MFPYIWSVAFSIAAVNVLSLSLVFSHFDYSVYLSLPLWVSPIWDSGFLDFSDCFFFLPRLRTFSAILLFKYFLRPFLSSSSRTPIMWILVHLLHQRSLKQSSLLFILFFFFFFFFPCSVTEISSTLNSSSLISSLVANLLRIPSSILFTLVIVFFFSGCSLFSNCIKNF